MAFPSAWRPNSFTLCTGNGLRISSNVRGVVTAVTDYPIPSKQIILSSSSDPVSSETRHDKGYSSSFTVGVDGKSNLEIPRRGEINISADQSIDYMKIRSTASLQFMEEMGMSRTSLKRLGIANITGPIYYFEVSPVTEGLCSDSIGRSIAIGLVSATDFVLNGEKCRIEIGYHSSGQFIHDVDTKSSREFGFGDRDIVGCGLEIGGKGRVFFTCNGHVVGNPFIGYGIRGESYYPIVSIEGISTCLRANFGSSRFEFHVDGLNICNYAFSFRERAIEESRHRAGSGAGSADNAAYVHWSTDDTISVQENLQMLDNIIKSHEDGFTGGGDNGLNTTQPDQYSLLESFNNLFHTKIEKALSDSFKTLSEFVGSERDSDTLDFTFGRRSGSSDFGTIVINPGNNSPDKINPKRRSSASKKKLSNNMLEIVQIIVDDNIIPLWEKMHKVISWKRSKVTH